MTNRIAAALLAFAASAIPLLAGSSSLNPPKAGPVEIMKSSEFPIDLDRVAALWQHGSVVRSWLLDLLVLALQQDPGLDQIRGYVDDSGEGRWTVFEAINESVPAPAISAALYARFASRQDESFAAKVAAALRNQFGGHAVRPAGS